MSRHRRVWGAVEGFYPSPVGTLGEEESLSRDDALRPVAEGVSESDPHAGLMECSGQAGELEALSLATSVFVTHHCRL